jgi:hypothetical protein
MAAVTEQIFSHAVALQQVGRLRSSIFVYKHDIYILNMDNTVILKFEIPLKEIGFESPIAFYANDYESADFKEEDGKIIFTTKNPKTGMVRRKTCRGAEITFDEVAEIFSRHYKKMRDPELARFGFEKEGLGYLEENLSHLEISGKEGQWLIVQRDIYTGATIEVERRSATLMGDGRDDLAHDFGPIGIRTPDFMALFSFNDSVVFYFPSKNTEVCFVRGERYKMKGVIAGCLYDELGTTEAIGEDHGRKKSKNRRGQQKARSTSGKGTRRRRRQT